MRVLVADDHRLFAEGMSNLLTAHGVSVVGAAKDGAEAVALAQSLKPDVVLMDIRMPGCDGLAATRLIKARHPEIKVVMLTTSAEDGDLFDSVKSGACGYLLKSVSGSEFIAALQGLEHGVPPFSPGLAGKILEEFARQRDPAETKPPGPASHSEAESAPCPGRHTNDATAGNTMAGLTARQTEVLKLVAAGLTYKEVGAKLGLSERTVRYHMVEIMERLHLKHRSQVIAYAGRLGLENSP